MIFCGSFSGSTPVEAVDSTRWAILLSFFKNKIRNRNIYKGAALASFLVSLLTVGVTYGLPFAFIDVLPLSAYQLNWILPAAAGGLIGSLIRDKSPAAPA